MPEKRERLTKFEYAVIFLNQKGRCGCGCGERLEEGKVDEEHTIPNYFKPGKPDSLWRRSCHKKKTDKDKADIAECKRRRGEKGQLARRKAGKTKPIPSPTKSMRQEQYKRKKEWVAKAKAERQ